MMLQQIEGILNATSPSFVFTCQRENDGSYSIMLSSLSHGIPMTTFVGISAAELQNESSVQRLAIELMDMVLED
ncbi:hypothetical protein D9M68_119570 [compost metagenome]|uniref:Uncharacterized protein n=1 Tax=Pseudomonas jinjuensis TaxID=198616 RepID=A0A1H0CWG1_9PSED|nr:hypothetical protein [Pseudomonas jinjuensis]SDN62250.1 hypothetical protein SAMN05216193_10449 [Pseudomonas jinjuensis]